MQLITYSNINSNTDIMCNTTDYNNIFYLLNNIVSVVEHFLNLFYGIFYFLIDESLYVIDHSVQSYFTMFEKLFIYSMGIPQIFFLTIMVVMCLLTFYNSIKIIVSI